MQARVVVVDSPCAPPLPAPQPVRRARDPTDLRDPLLHAMMRAHRASGRSLATSEQTLAELVLKMRLVDAMQR